MESSLATNSDGPGIFNRSDPIDGTTVLDRFGRFLNDSILGARFSPCCISPNYRANGWLNVGSVVEAEQVS